MSHSASCSLFLKIFQHLLISHVTTVLNHAVLILPSLVCCSISCDDFINSFHVMLLFSFRCSKKQSMISISLFVSCTITCALLTQSSSLV